MVKQHIKREDLCVCVCVCVCVCEGKNCRGIKKISTKPAVVEKSEENIFKNNHQIQVETCSISRRYRINLNRYTRETQCIREKINITVKQPNSRKVWFNDSQVILSICHLQNIHQA